MIDYEKLYKKTKVGGARQKALALKIMENWKDYRKDYQDTKGDKPKFNLERARIKMIKDGRLKHQDLKVDKSNYRTLLKEITRQEEEYVLKVAFFIWLEDISPRVRIRSTSQHIAFAEMQPIKYYKRIDKRQPISLSAIKVAMSKEKVYFKMLGWEDENQIKKDIIKFQKRGGKFIK